MRTVSAFFANVFLFFTVASIMVVGGAVFAFFLFFPLVLLSLLGVFVGLEHRRVASTNPR